MALYALGDMHLAFSVDKPMDRFGKVWKKHEEKLEKNCRKLIGNEDTFVITGDHCWGKNLSEAKTDLAFIADLPGNKILLRGNHDMFWDAKKTAVLNQEYEPQLHFLQNNHYHYQDYALVGTKGYTFEGPFYINSKGQIVGWDEANEKQAKKLVAREAERLRISFESAREAGFRKYIMFLPLSANKYRGRGEYLHADGRRVRSGACCIFPLPRRVPLRRQYPRSSPWDPVSPGFWRLPQF